MSKQPLATTDRVTDQEHSHFCNKIYHFWFILFECLHRQFFWVEMWSLLCVAAHLLLASCCLARSDQDHTQNIVFQSHVLGGRPFAENPPTLHKRSTESRVHFTFNHGVASGDPSEDSVILWTRISPSLDQNDNGEDIAIPVYYQVAHAPRQNHSPFHEPSEIIRQGRAYTSAVVDWVVKLDIVGLDSNSVYYYRFFSGQGSTSTIGRTISLPRANQDFPKFRIGTFSCSNYPFGYFNAYRHAAQNNLDLILHLGDYIYEYANGRYGDGTPLGRVHEPNKEIVSLSDYRTRHLQYKSDVDSQLLHSRVPWVVVWDDHEFADDSWVDGAINHNQFQQGSWTDRKAAAMRSYFEYMPIRPLPILSPGKIQIFRTFDIGKLLSLILLDTRMYGREHTDLFAKSKVFFENRTILGHDQESWFHDELTHSKNRGAKWRLVGNQIIFAPFRPAFRIAVGRDCWDNYPRNRERVLHHIALTNISNVVFLTGDIHSSWVHEVPLDPWAPKLYNANSGQGSYAVEFVGPSVTSPAPGEVKQKFNWVVKKLEQVGLQQEPHLKFVDLSRHGYMVTEVTEENVRQEYWYVSTIRSRSSSAVLGAVFNVNTGYSKVHRVV